MATDIAQQTICQCGATPEIRCGLKHTRLWKIPFRRSSPIRFPAIGGPSGLDKFEHPARNFVSCAATQLIYADLRETWHHRRSATSVQIPSTKPNGHAPCKNP